MFGSLIHLVSKCSSLIWSPNLVHIEARQHSTFPIAPFILVLVRLLVLIEGWTQMAPAILRRVREQIVFYLAGIQKSLYKFSSSLEITSTVIECLQA